MGWFGGFHGSDLLPSTMAIAGALVLDDTMRGLAELPRTRKRSMTRTRIWSPLTAICQSATDG